MKIILSIPIDLESCNKIPWCTFCYYGCDGQGISNCNARKEFLKGHTMWFDLVDNLNRKRESIFYKAAFYDRSVHISFRSRYRYEVITYLEEDNQKYSDFYEEKNHTPIFGRIYDGDKIIFETTHDFFTEKFDNNNPKVWWENYNAFERSKCKECIDWLNKNYPDWNNIYSYW